MEGGPRVPAPPNKPGVSRGWRARCWLPPEIGSLALAVILPGHPGDFGEKTPTLGRLGRAEVWLGANPSWS